MNMQGFWAAYKDGTGSTPLIFSFDSANQNGTLMPHAATSNSVAPGMNILRIDGSGEWIGSSQMFNYQNLPYGVNLYLPKGYRFFLGVQLGTECDGSTYPNGKSYRFYSTGYQWVQTPYSAGYSAVAYENNLLPLVEKFGGHIEIGELAIGEGRKEEGRRNQ